MGRESMSRRDAVRLLAAASAFAMSSSVVEAESKARRPSMLTKPIPSTGEALPVIGLGSWQTFDVGASEKERAPLREVLRLFAELGGRLVDSSPMYGRAEGVIGDLAAGLGLRDHLYLATKVWTSGREAGLRQMEESFRLLRAEKVDLMQVHNLVDLETHMAVLRDWKAAGRFRHIGITHYHAGSHAEVAKAMEAHPVDFVQINYSVGEREAERRILPLAAEKGIAVIANRPFSGGSLFRRLRSRPLPPWAASIDCATWAQVLLKFAVSHPTVTCAIPATSKAAHLRDNMGAGVGRMPGADLRERIAREAA
jgi:diketogulonate reductase-like aldo/keto reductase